MIRQRQTPATAYREAHAASEDRTASAPAHANPTPEPYGAGTELVFGGSGGEDMTAHDREVDRRTHALIAGFCRDGQRPDPVRVWRRTAELFAASPVSHNHAARQRAACAVAVYFSRLQRPWWEFVGDADLGTGRDELVWRTPAGAVVLDEIRTGMPGQALASRELLEQLTRDQEAAAAAFGSAFAGVRLLPLTAPGRARFHPHGGVALPLADAPAEVR